jgi:hypothetical protein
LCGFPLLVVSHAAMAENAVALAVQRLHLSPQQLLSLRDFLGAFNRGVAVDSSGNGLFVLRDVHSMAYAGEFLLRTDAGGTLTVDRMTGPATLDAAREVQVPLRLDAKARLQASAALSESQALPANGTTQAGPPLQQISGGALTSAAQPATILQSRAVFFRDGSGYTASVRAVIPATPSPVAPLRVIERYYASIKSDGKQAWRPATVEVDGDVVVAFTDLEKRYGCAAPGPCAARGKLPAAANLHVIRWGRQDITGVPVTLMAQLGPAAQTVPAPAPGDMAAPQQSAPDQPPEAPDTGQEAPQNSNGI